MAKKNFYVVVKGLVPGIYTTWTECQKNTNGYPGAVFKGFATKEEAQVFFESQLKSEKDVCPEEQIENIKDEEKEAKRVAEAVAYVDGSYEDTKKQYAYGVVMFYGGKEEHFAEKAAEPSMVEMRNVAGEIEGAKRAINFCIDNGIKSLDIIYDYEGIEKWCTGVWKANKIGTKKYKEFYDKAKQIIDIKFIKVKGHSGDQYNDLADALAKGALGIGGEVISEKEGGIVANNIEYEDLIQIVELLKEDFEDANYVIEDTLTGKKITVETYNPKYQRVVISHYKKKNKIQIQGKKEELFHGLSLFIIELIECNEIPQFLNTVHNLSVDNDVVEEAFLQCFPNSHDKFPSAVKNYLHQAVYNLHITGNNMYATNFLVEPAIRSLEAILKIALKDNDIPIRKETMNYDSFFVFESAEDRYILKEQYKKETHSEELLGYLSEAYTFFNKNRHTLLHWDDPTAPIDTSRVLNTVVEAHTLIIDTIKLIDKYYIIV